MASEQLQMFSKQLEEFTIRRAEMMDVHQHIFYEASFQYVAEVQSVQERMKFEFLETLSSFFYSWLTFYHVGYVIHEDFKPFLDRLQDRVQKNKESYMATIAEAKELIEKMLKTHTKAVCQSGQANNIPGTVATGGPERSMTTKQDYVLQEKSNLPKTIGRDVLAGKWTKYYCVYSKETRIFTMVPITASSKTAFSMDISTPHTPRSNGLCWHMCNGLQTHPRLSSALVLDFPRVATLLFAIFSAICSTMTKESYAKMPAAISRYIIDYFVKNGDTLLNDTNLRTVAQNSKRSTAYKNLIAQIREEFGFEINEKKIRNHFDHIRSKVIAKGMAQKRSSNAEKRYRIKTGAGVSQFEESSFSKNDVCPFSTPQEEKLWSYFDKTPTTVPFKEGESIVGKRKAVTCESRYHEDPEPNMEDFQSDSDLFEYDDDEEEEERLEERRAESRRARSREDVDVEMRECVVEAGAGSSNEGIHIENRNAARAHHEVRFEAGYRPAEAEMYEACPEEAPGGDNFVAGRGRAGGTSRRRRISERDLIEEQYRLFEDQRRFFQEMTHTFHVFCDYIQSQKERTINGQHGGLGGGGSVPANAMVDGNIEESAISSE